MVGYSKKLLKEKLGLKDNMSFAILHAPKMYDSLLGKKISDKVTADMDFIHYFSRSNKQLIEDFPKLKNAIKTSGILWISWPKSTCSFASTDLTENTVRSIGLKQGLVDVKVIAVDKDWSALKFVYRLKDR